MKKFFSLSSFLMTTLLICAGCTKQNINNYQAMPSSNSGNTITSLATGTIHQFQTIQGDNITIVENGNIGFDFPQYRGKIIIFEVFGKECEYCFEEMPIINSIQREFSDSVQIIAIQGQDRILPSQSSSFLAEHDINYPVIEGEDAKELLRFLADTYSWTGILPYILIIKDGSTEQTFPDGSVSYTELKDSINSLL